MTALSRQVISAHEYPPHDGLPASLCPHPGLVAVPPLPVDLAVVRDGDPQLLGSVPRPDASVLMHPAQVRLDGCLLVEEVLDIISGRDKIIRGCQRTGE